MFAGLLAWKDAKYQTADFASFFTVANLIVILIQTAIVAIGALGMTMIIISGGIDLSVGSVVALTSVIGAVLIRDSSSVATAVAVTILAGGFIGLINGTLIAAFRLTPFIVTLGMLGVARGLAKGIAQNQTVNFPESAIARIMNEPMFFESMPPGGVALAILLAIFMGVLMQQTVFGRYIFAIGSNEATARLCGIRTRRIKIFIYSLGGLFFGTAGVMQLSRLRQGDPTAAVGLELDLIAAVVIGGASLNGGTGSILGSMIGALTMAVLRTGSQYMDWPTYMQEIIIGVLIILAVGLDQFRQRRRKMTGGG
ncbi:MAG TPA: ABC transporter permease [Tepidisphaeraceae bacterium]|nr:ABC transporter permease [Tepidisphaeraceae bacterium]